MLNIAKNLDLLRDRIGHSCKKAGRNPGDVTIIAVTKTVSPEAIQQAFRHGVRHFGENRVQEAEGKLPLLGNIATEATWHMLGHLQSNKVKLALALFHTVDSVDSLKLALALEGHATKKLPVLLEVNVAGEVSKGGLAAGELPSVAARVRRMSHLELRGLMTVAPLVPDPEEVRKVFRELKELGDSLGLPELSMGMSHDYEVAIEEGATMIRIGRAIFRERKT